MEFESRDLISSSDIEQIYAFIHFWEKTKKVWKIFMPLCVKKNIVNDHDLYTMHGAAFIEVPRVIFYSHRRNPRFFYLSHCSVESNVTGTKPVGSDDALYPVWFDPWLLTIRSTTNGGLLLFKVLCLARKGFSIYMYWADSTLMSRLFRPGPFTS